MLKHSVLIDAKNAKNIKSFPRAVFARHLCNVILK